MGLTSESEAFATADRAWASEAELATTMHALSGLYMFAPAGDKVGRRGDQR